MTSRKGFTLIELLVVIAIIAILAAILFPVFARAREKARQASCQSNLKQLELGMHMYAQDYDEMWARHGCTWWAPPTAWPGEHCYAAQIYPYIKNTQIFRCPSFSSGVTPGGNGNSYGNNLCVFGRTSVAMASILKPAELIHLSDSQAGYCSAAVGAGNCPLNVQLVPASTRHNDGADVAYVDGHVKWHKSTDLLTPSKWTNQ
jgi:prepilin-type N-terminal cleavage/methylation domain-containing protein/prepilin-type processing-associated H-X9-DG protein